MNCENCPFLTLSGGPCPGAERCEVSPHALTPGTCLHGRYAVGRVLGEGGFGITYYGVDMTLRSPVAIKEYFPPDRASRAGAGTMSLRGHSGASGPLFQSGKERFLQEARVMAKMIRTPNIVGVRDYFEENNTAYIVMDYLGGITLRELMEERGGRIPASELLPLLEPIFPALQKLHGEGLIHRDINPENLMLDGGKIYLLDFGCARENVEDATMTVTLRHGFAPIEQYQPSGGGQGPWTDVYALAATIYYCLTGEKPVHAMDRLLEDNLTPPNRLGAGLNDAQERALLRALTVRPNRRTRSAEELYRDLYRGEGKAPRRRSKAAIACAAAAAVLAVGIGLYSWLRPAPDEPPTPPEQSDPADPSAPPEDETEPEALFEGATELSTALMPNGFILNDLRELMEDDSVKSVVIPSGFYVDVPAVDGPLIISKPLLVKSGASLAFNTCVWVQSTMVVEEGANVNRGTVTVSGGRLMLDGYFHGILITEKGGSAVVSPTATADFQMLWLERSSDLSHPGVMIDLSYFLSTWMEEDREFDTAVSVTDFASLKASASGTYPVRVDASTVVEGDLTVTAPLIIPAGVTLTVPEGSRLCCSDKLRVDGSIAGNVELSGHAVLYNYGSASVAGASAPPEDVRILNVGKLTVAEGEYRHLTLLNNGTVEVCSPGGKAVLRDSALWSFGALNVLEDSRLVSVGANYLHGDGTVSVGRRGVLENASFMTLCGSVTLYGDVVNTGGQALAVEASCTLICRGGRIRGGMAIVPEGATGLQDAFGEDCFLLPFVNYAGPETYVHNASELIEALSAPDSGFVVLQGEAELEELTLTGTLRVSNGGSLRVGKLTIDGGLIQLFSDMSGGPNMIYVKDLAVINGGHLQIQGGGVSFDEGGSLTMRGGFARITDPGTLWLNGCPIIMDLRSGLANHGTVEDCGSLQISGGSYLYDCSVLTLLPNADVTLSPDSTYSPNSIRLG